VKLFALAALAALAARQDKVEFKFAPKQGDKVRGNQTMKMEIKANAGGQEFEITFKGTKKGTVTYAEVAEGRVTKKILDVEEDLQEQTMPGADEPQIQEQPLHKKKVTIVLKEGKTVVECDEEIDDKAKKKLKLEEAHVKFFPKRAVAVGDTWDIEGEDLKAAMEDEDFTGGKVTMKLKAVKEIDKRRCAVLEAKWDLTGKTDNNLDMEVKLEGEMVVWLDRGYVLSMKAKGTMKLSGEEQGFEGEGPMTIEEKSTVEEEK
jgi:hypothetical protein